MSAKFGECFDTDRSLDAAGIRHAEALARELATGPIHRILGK